ncbi:MULTISPECIES: WD40 repeat domain-containing protein [Actinosynnema]|uniref:WD40 repeat domain-containing protein n=1 Tax=Actinosynnema TaxID=40566 RepID=UPI0020A43F03|nr:WD40 repeat domain-containing protein [Actinosynnema pretiosum]
MLVRPPVPVAPRTGGAVDGGAVARRVAGFLREGRGLLVVTGAPALHAWDVGPVDAVVRVRGLTSVEVVERLVLALGGNPVWALLAGRRLPALREQVRTTVADRESLTVVLDGLHHAADPARLAADVVGPLLRLTGPEVKLVVGADDELLPLLRRFAGFTELVRAEPAPDRLGALLRDLRATATPEHPVTALLAVLRAAALTRDVPRGPIWAALATAVAGEPVAEATVEHVLTALGDHLAEDLLDGAVVHRLADDVAAELLDGLSDPTQIHRRVAEALPALLPAAPDQPPHPYLRRRLVEHATLGGVLDDAHVPARFLPWDTSGAVRAGLGTPLPDDPERAGLARWAVVEPFLACLPPRSRAFTHDVAHPDHPPLAGDLPWGLRTRWANWKRWGGQLPVEHHQPYAMLGVPVQGGRALLATHGERDEGDGLLLWDVTTGEQVGSADTGRRRQVPLLPVPLPDGRTLLATGQLGADRLLLWDLDLVEEVAAAPAEVRDPRELVAVPLPGGPTLIAASLPDGRVVLWNPEDPQERWPTPSADGVRVSSLTAVPLPDGRTALAVTVVGHGLRVWDPAGGTWIGPVIDLPEQVPWGPEAIRVAGGRVLLAVGSARGTALLWDPVTGERVGGPPTGYAGWARLRGWLHRADRSLVIGIAGLGELRLWDPVTGERVGPLLSADADEAHLVTAVDLPDGRTALVTGGEDEMVRLWDVTRESWERTTWAYRVEPVTAPDGRVLLAVEGPDGVRRWDPGTGELVDPRAPALETPASWSSPTARFRAPDGRTVLADADAGEGLVRLRDESGEVLLLALDCAASALLPLPASAATGGVPLLVVASETGFAVLEVRG